MGSLSSSKEERLDIWIIYCQEVCMISIVSISSSILTQCLKRGFSPRVGGSDVRNLIFVITEKLFWLDS